MVIILFQLLMNLIVMSHIHIVFYLLIVMLREGALQEVTDVSFTLGASWYLMGIGFVLLVVSPFLKKSS